MDEDRLRDLETKIAAMELVVLAELRHRYSPQQLRAQQRTAARLHLHGDPPGPAAWEAVEELYRRAETAQP